MIKFLYFLIPHLLSISFGKLSDMIVNKVTGIIYRRSENKKIEEESERLKKHHRILSLSHYKPVIEELDNSDKLFIPFPKEYEEEVNKYNPMFLQDAIPNWLIFKNGKKQVPDDLAKLLYEGIKQAKDCYSDKEKGLDPITAEEIKTIILQSRDSVAKDFVDQLKKGFIRFNGIMYGVKDINNDESKKESRITLFTTDYFTNRVMNEVYKSLAERKAIKDFDSLNLVKIFYPLMTALGVDVIIQLQNRTTMLVRRSELLPNMDEKKPLWHVSMNEAISHTDYADDDRNEKFIDLERCLVRGLYEELHIPKNAISLKTARFDDVYFLMSKCEIGIASTVKLKRNVTEELIRFAHYGAKDSMLESKETMKTVTLTPDGIKQFIKEQDEKINDDIKDVDKPEIWGISESCRYVLTMMMCRMH